jgi:hypothetical protein
MILVLWMSDATASSTNARHAAYGNALMQLHSVAHIPFSVCDASVSHVDEVSQNEKHTR